MFLRTGESITEYTRYWGYDGASQISGNNTVVMQRSSSAATASRVMKFTVS